MAPVSAGIALIPVEAWCNDSGTTLVQVAQAMEGLGWMVLAQNAGQNSQPNTTLFGHPSNTTSIKASGNQTASLATPAQPSQATLEEIDAIIELLSHRHHGA